MSAVDLLLEPADNERLANLCGQFDEHLRLLERRTGVAIGNRGNAFKLSGDDDAVVVTEQVLRRLYELTASRAIAANDVHLELANSGESDELVVGGDDAIRTRRTLIRARGANQRRYLQAIRDHDISFGIGPAGTGKTYLAVASAVAALESDSVRRVCLVRPAVEAGERLGFLPGDMAQKIDPYLRPLYDALYEMLGFERVAKLIERNVIEVAPLAFMRGRTLNESFVILDEAQNTTIEQMKMFLT
ncbi:MAG: PhoH family protein, partial [Gammaproteobacteria bacterium]|nr:PhoH family protein [Gammaproteobacteria bacterium]